MRLCILTLVTFSFCSATLAQQNTVTPSNIVILDDKDINSYRLTDQELKAASKGWELYLKKKISLNYNGGAFTDPINYIPGFEFWSNGKIAITNIDKKGHCENIFLVKDKKLIYLGAVGLIGKFIYLSKKYHKHIHAKLSYSSPNGLFLKLYFKKGHPQAEADVRLNYILNDHSTEAASIGWKLYKKNKIINTHDKGNYVFAYVNKKGYGFWSNGKVAKIDRENNGHYETLFKIKNDELIYVGSFDMKEEFINAAERFNKLIDKLK